MFANFLNSGVLEALFVSIPESLGLLAFGIGLMGVAATGRWLLNRTETKKHGEAAPEA